jgi:hypothetical protein
LGFGAPEKDNSYETIYALGYPEDKEDFGLYRSTNKGKSWKKVSDNTISLSQTVPYSISGDFNAFGRVYIGTHGNGIIVGDVRNN